jgi:hypothetical protein
MAASAISCCRRWRGQEHRFRRASSALASDEVPASGQPAEVLRHHGLDSASLKDRIRQELKA